VKEYQQNKWYLTTWNITNVLPLKNRIEEGIAAFPEEIPYRLIKLFSYVGENVLDPFMGSGTTNKVVAMLGRNSVGYEIDLELCEVVKEKKGLKQSSLFEKNYEVEIIIREDAKHLRTYLQEKININCCIYLSSGQKRFPLKPLQGFQGTRLRYRNTP